jgi:hypothetical protein
MAEFGEIVLTIVASLTVGYIVLLGIGFLFDSDRIEGEERLHRN